MKDLLKQYVSKGYEPTFYKRLTKTLIPYRLEYEGIPIEKLELYLMRDWLEERGYGILVIERVLGKWKSDVVPKLFNTRLEALKSALEEAIKHV